MGFLIIEASSGDYGKQVYVRSSAEKLHDMKNTVGSERNVTELKKQRYSGYELLRILAMFLIVAHHFFIHGTDIPKLTPLLEGVPAITNGVNLLFVQGGKFGCGVFIALTGYFSVEKDNNWKHLIPIERAVLTYSVGFYLLAVFSGYTLFSVRTLIKTLMPISFVGYWFITAYFVLYLFSPWLNRVLNALSEREYRNVMKLVLLLIFVIPLANKVSALDYYDRYSGYIWSSMIWFAVYYALGGYLRKYKTPKKQYISWSALLYIAVFLVRWGLTVQFPDNLLVQTLCLYSYWDNSIFMLLCTAWLIRGFGALHFQSDFVNRIAGASLGVYLIHDNDSIRVFLWQGLLKTTEKLHEPWFWLWAIAVVVGLYVICTAVELLRKYCDDFVMDRLRKAGITEQVMAGVEKILQKIEDI